MHQVEFKFIQGQIVRVLTGDHAGEEFEIKTLFRGQCGDSYGGYIGATHHIYDCFVEENLELVAETVDLTLSAIDETT